tara:strand:- start:499 stop:1176 length:678 start_codon:yes stop_codon:yes gene_type:complete
MIALKRAGVEDDTIVVFMSDHGYHLGEHSSLCKQSNFEIVTKIPLMIKVPGTVGELGDIKRCKGLVEAIDIFPTVVDLAGLNWTLAGLDKIDGTSFRGMLERAIVGEACGEWKEAVFSQYPRCGKSASELNLNNPCSRVDSDKFRAMGYTVRTANWRYTAWMRWNSGRVDWEGGAPLAEELYSHEGIDPRAFAETERVNVANKSDLTPIRMHLFDLLRKNFKVFI